MSSNLRPSSQDPDLEFVEFLTRAPAQFKSQFNAGVGVAARLTDKQITSLVEIVGESIGWSTTADADTVASKLGITKPESANLLIVANLVAAGVATSEISAEQMVQQINKAVQLGESESEGMTRFVRGVATYKDSLKQSLARSSLHTSSLPYMTDFETTVDIRPSFNNDTNHIDFAIPILVVHIDTDKYGEEIWFQLSKRQVEKMNERLKTALGKMEAAETWASRKVSNPQS